MHLPRGGEHFMPLLVCVGAGGDEETRLYLDDYLGIDSHTYYWDHLQSSLTNFVNHIDSIIAQAASHKTAIIRSFNALEKLAAQPRYNVDCFSLRAGLPPHSAHVVASSLSNEDTLRGKAFQSGVKKTARIWDFSIPSLLFFVAYDRSKQGERFFFDLLVFAAGCSDHLNGSHGLRFLGERADKRKADTVNGTFSHQGVRGSQPGLARFDFKTASDRLATLVKEHDDVTAPTQHT
ncbi:hypothetical protein ColLi_13997 [Colletotrichum liriopes]|uniref:Uncharacterized protein n=1 Tax=Colletotrichum liriopes TaxID=708192 RepID=A0AA37H274_9PEZI|nr:hypothetical protein ColLi_13997 [Colletotrichum liriopes]